MVLKAASLLFGDLTAIRQNHIIVEATSRAPEQQA
jgi:hypothetical protein